MKQWRTFRRRAVAIASAAALSLGAGADLTAQISTYQAYYGTDAVDEAKGGILYTRDGGYITVGMTRNGSLDRDVYVVKTDRCGNIGWSKRYNIGTNNDDIGRKIREVPAPDSGYVIVGSTRRTTSATTEDAFLMKITPSGVPVWTRTYGSVIAEDDGNDLCIDGFGQIYVAGNTRAPGGGGVMDAWMFSATPVGLLSWSHRFGGRSQEMFSGIDLGCNGNVIAVGYTSTHGDLNRFDRDIYAVSIPTTGFSPNWIRRYGRPDSDEWANTVVARGSDLFIGGGHLASSSPGVSKEIIVQAHCNSGALVNDMLYTHAFPPDPSAHVSEIFELQSLANNNIVGVGQWEEGLLDLHLFEVSTANLNMLNTSVFGVDTTDQAGYSVAVTTNDPMNYNVVAAGFAQLEPMRSPDIFVVAADSSLRLSGCGNYSPFKQEDPALLDSAGPGKLKDLDSVALSSSLPLDYGDSYIECRICYSRRAVPPLFDLSYRENDVKVEVRDDTAPVALKP